MKEIEFKFNDGSTYTVRRDGVGDTIMGPDAHTVMHDMNHTYNYENQPMAVRIDFILNHPKAARL